MSSLDLCLLTFQYPKAVKADREIAINNILRGSFISFLNVQIGRYKSKKLKLLSEVNLQVKI